MESTKSTEGPAPGVSGPAGQSPGTADPPAPGVPGLLAGALERRWVLLAATVAGALGFLAYLTEIRDWDMFHHMAYGREIARHGLFAEEPFLFPFRGTSIGPPPYWLGSLVIYLWAAAFGEGAMSWLAAAMGGLLACVLFLDSKPRRGPWTWNAALVAAAVLIPTLLLGRGRAFARPEIFATVLLAAVMLALRRFEEGHRRPLLALPLVAVVWTNLHPSFPTAVVPLAIMVAVGLASHALGRLRGLEPRETPAPRDLGLAAAAGAMALLAALITPTRGEPLALSFRFASLILGGGPAASPDRTLTLLKRMVFEMQPLRWSSLRDVIGVVVGLTVLGFLLNARRTRPRELLTVIAFGFLAAGAQRFAVMLAIVAAPITARNLGEALGQVPGRPWARWARPLGVALLSAVAIGGGAWFEARSIDRFGTGMRAFAYPIRAVDYLLANGIEGPLFNTFQYGGYVEWRTGGTTYQDGRGLLRPGDEDAAFNGPSSYGLFEGLDEKYRFEALVVTYPSPDPSSAAALSPAGAVADWGADRRTWALVAFDDGGMLYLRRGGRHQASIDRDEFRILRPANGTGGVEGADAAAFIGEARRSVDASPGCVRCRTLLGVAALSTGAFEDAWNAVAPSIGERSPERAGAMLVGAQAADALGKVDTAARLYRRGIAFHQNENPARRALARLEARRGRTGEALKVLAPALESAAAGPVDVQLAMELLRAAGRNGEAAALAPRLQRLRIEEVAATYLGKGVSAASQGNAQAAVAWLQAALAVNETPEARMQLGRVLFRLGRHEEAEVQQRRAIALAPDHARAWYALGETLAARGDRPGAVTAFRRCLEIEPSGYLAARAQVALERMAR